MGRTHPGIAKQDSLGLGCIGPECSSIVKRMVDDEIDSGVSETVCGYCAT